MSLTKEEAIYFILKSSYQNKISSKTKLNKILAYLNLEMIPIDIAFSLNKFGSYSTELEFVETDNFKIYEYSYLGKKIEGLELKTDDKNFDEKIEKKLLRLFSIDYLNKIKMNIFEKSKISASELSENEHKDLLVDINDRDKLLDRANFNAVDYLDLYDQSKKLSSDSFVNIKLKGLIEYCFELAKFLKQKISKIPENEYDYDANMNTYYYLKILEIKKDFLETQLKEVTDETEINKLFEYFVRRKDDYSFSIHNPNLNKLRVSI